MDERRTTLKDLKRQSFTTIESTSYVDVGHMPRSDLDDLFNGIMFLFDILDGTRNRTEIVPAARRLCELSFALNAWIQNDVRSRIPHELPPIIRDTQWLLSVLLAEANDPKILEYQKWVEHHSLGGPPPPLQMEVMKMSA